MQSILLGNFLPQNKLLKSFQSIFSILVIFKGVCSKPFFTSPIFHAHVLSWVQLFVIGWSVAHQTPLSMGFSRQQYWSRLSFPTPGDIPDLGMENASPMSPALAGGYFTLCLESPGLGFDGGNVFCLQEILRKGSEFFSEWYHLLHCPVFHIYFHVTCNVHWLYSINARSLIQIHQLEIQYFMIYMIYMI